MTPNPVLAALRQRIAKAVHDRDALRATSTRETYLEACSMVEALELQLERLMRSRY
jgi:hypothetical protein